MGRGFESLQIHSVVGVAQLVRAPDCGSGGRGFNSHHSPVDLFCEPLAQVVEHLTFNQGVASSSLA